MQVQYRGLHSFKNEERRVWCVEKCIKGENSMKQ